MPGAVYVGYLSGALKDIAITDVEKHPELAGGNLCLPKPGELYIVYLPGGGKTEISGAPVKGTWKWFDPQTGKFVSEGSVDGSETFESHGEAPYVLIVQKQ